MKIAAIAGVAVVRTLRDRTGLFFVFALPIVIIVVFGLAFGGSGARSLGVADEDRSGLSRELVSLLHGEPDAIDVVPFATASELRAAVQRNTVDAGVVIAAGYERALRDGDQAQVEFLARPEVISSAVKPLVADAVAGQAALVRAARFAQERGSASFDDALRTARATRAEGRTVEILDDTTGDRLIEEGMNGYLMGAQSQLVLFMFLTSMTAAAQFISARQLGITRRMAATPTRASTILAGELLGRFGVVMIQGLFIVAATALVFRVEWGDPLATAAIVVAFGLVGTGTAMVVGVLASNAEQASSIGVGVAMLLGAFGGAMVPPEVFPELMRTLSNVTPHAWAIDAFRELTLRDGTLASVVPQLTVLLAFAAALLTLATTRFRRVLHG